MLVELDRVGVFPARELGKGASDGRLPIDERCRRVQALVRALSLLWGGGRTARMLTDLSPQFLVYARLKVKTPLFLEAVQVAYQQGRYVLQTESILHALDRLPAEWRETVLFGYAPNFFANESSMRQELANAGTVMTIAELIPAILKDIEEGLRE
jgi:CRISPR-associated protein Cst2